MNDQKEMTTIRGSPLEVGSPPSIRTPNKPPPRIPDYELLRWIGGGSYGEVWLARSVLGDYRAVKIVYRRNFEHQRPYDREFEGIRKYEPISRTHESQVDILHVGRNDAEGYFYYVMELGDGQVAGWQKDPATYKPWNLAFLRAQAPNNRLPVKNCVRIGLALSEALDFLHRKGLTHRDIKPSNVIFVNEQPKLADVGLVTDIRPPAQIHTYVGTPGYMPPAPEPPGTVEADLYALGMLLYVTSTGREPDFFPNLSTTLVERTGRGDFIQLNAVILKACQPDPARRSAHPRSPARAHSSRSAEQQPTPGGRRPTPSTAARPETRPLRKTSPAPPSRQARP
jgi:serine/threonine protein kinase